MDVGSGAAVTFNGASNIMKSNTAPINKGKSISSISANLKFIICHPGNTNTPKTYTGLYPGDKIEDDLDKCDADIITCYQYIKDICECDCTVIPYPVCGNLASGGTRLSSNPFGPSCNSCAANTYAKDDETDCVANTICGDLASGGTRLTDDSRTVAGTCTACAVNTYAPNNVTDCLANTVCGNQVAGGTRLTGSSRTVAGTCNSCTDNTWAVNEKENCEAHTVCGKQVNSTTRTIVTSGTLTTNTQCQACFAGTWGENAEDCKVCEIGTFSIELLSQRIGNKVCQACPNGQWQNQQGQVSCIKCVKGKVLRLTKQTSDTCVECIIGSYNPYEGHSGNCLPCLTANVIGSIKCEGW